MRTLTALIAVASLSLQTSPPTEPAAPRQHLFRAGQSIVVTWPGHKALTFGAPPRNNNRFIPQHLVVEQRAHILASVDSAEWGLMTLSGNSEAIALARDGRVAVIRSDDAQGTVIISDPALADASSLVVAGSTAFIAAHGAIYSLNLDTHSVIREYYPDVASSGVPLSELALDPSSGILAGLSVDSHSLVTFHVHSPIASKNENSGLSALRPGKVIALADLHSIPSAFDIYDDAAYFIDSTSRLLSVVPLTAGGVFSIDCSELLSTPRAIMIDAANSAMYFADGDRVTSLPLIAPASFYAEGGEPSDIIVRLYNYLHERRLLPTTKYIVNNGDTIAAIVTVNKVLPAGYDDSIRPLICALNAGFCKQNQFPAHYRVGQVIVLPDVVRKSYTGRRELSLPVDFQQYKSNALTALQTSPLVTVSDVAVALNPQLPASDRTGALEVLNYTYRGQRLLSETRGQFVFPVPGWKVKAFVPVADWHDAKSPLRQVLSKNLTLTIGSQVTPEALSTSLQTTPQASPEPMRKSQGANCATVPASLWSTAFDTIHYCLPRSVPPVDVGVIDNGFDPSHRAFQVDRLCFILSGLDTACARLPMLPVPTRKPISDAQFYNFDAAVDHGTHVAGLVGAGPVADAMSVGLDPAVNIYASTLAHARDLYTTNLKLSLFNVSLGEDPKLPQPEQFDDLKKLIDSNFAHTLFVIAAGDNVLRINPGYLAGLGARSNVIVVGASTLGATPTIESYSARGRDFVSIAAPGTLIESTVYGGGYGSATGTSMAAAMVTGTAAILRGLDPFEPPYITKELIIASADVWEIGTDVLSGELNVQNAIAAQKAALIIVRDADGNECRSSGKLKSLDLKQPILITRDHQFTALRYADLRRIHRNREGTLTILYTVHKGEGDNEQLKFRAIERIDNVDPRNITLSPIRFDYEGERCAGPLVDVRTLQDFINAVYE